MDLPFGFARYSGLSNGTRPRTCDSVCLLAPNIARGGILAGNRIISAGDPVKLPTWEDIILYNCTVMHVVHMFDYYAENR